jgi:hypothetical protein
MVLKVLVTLDQRERLDYQDLMETLDHWDQVETEDQQGIQV